jgi:hypothetical protein
MKGNVQLAAYSGTSTTSPVAGFAGAASHVTATTAKTPTVTAPAAGDWLVSSWTAKSSGVSSWAAPGGVASRNLAVGTGGGQLTALLGDSGGPVSAGPAGGLTATANQSFSAADTLSLILAPAP